MLPSHAKNQKLLFSSFKVLTLSLGTIAFAMSSASAQTLLSQAPPDVVIETESEGGESETNATGVRFTCEVHEGQYTVMYNPESQPGESYPWAVPSQMGGGWSPQKRCEAITSRLESYRPDGLVELTTGIENNYDVLCVTTEVEPDCRIVLTVPPGKNPEVVRDLVFENLTVADSGQSTQGVNTYTGDGNNDWLNPVGDLLGIDLPTLGGNSSSSNGGINLKPFLDIRDGGTGTMLRPSSSHRTSPGRTLNPDNFR